LQKHDDWRSLLTRIKAKRAGRETVFVGVTLPKITNVANFEANNRPRRANHLNDYIEGFNPVVRTDYSDNPFHYLTLDLESFRNNARDNADGLHFNARGYRDVADELRDIIVPKLNQLNP
jgi:lysophospholipase L1-like esterase